MPDTTEAPPAHRLRRFDEVEVLRDGDDPIADGERCCACAEPFEAGDRVLMVPYLPAPSRLLATSHLHCAIENDEVDLDSPPAPILALLRSVADGLGSVQKDLMAIPTRALDEARSTVASLTAAVNEVIPS